MIRTIAVAGYRSLRAVVLPLGGLTVVTGPNGSGKSSLYRAVRLLAQSALGRLPGELAVEGGLSSVFWAGPESSTSVRRGQPLQGTTRSAPIALRLGVATDELGYQLDIGVPARGERIFPSDITVRSETVFAGESWRPSGALARRHHGAVQISDGRSWQTIAGNLPTDASMLSEYGDPHAMPELLAARKLLRGWRFYDGFRVDADAPVRRPSIGVRTPVLAEDGSDLVPAILTAKSMGERLLAPTIADAFDGATLDTREHLGRYELRLRQPGMLRTLWASELSDGTLRYLLWTAALLTERPPPLLVLNEPETSLHPELIPPLGRLILQVAQRTQIIVVSHYRPLIDAIGAVRLTDVDRDADGEDAGGDVRLELSEIRRLATGQAVELELAKKDGETVIRGLDRMNTPPWSWAT